MSIPEATPDSIGAVPTDLVLLIPMGAPLPREVEDIPLVTGTLYQRLAPLAVPGSGWVFLPCDTMEIHDLGASWERLVTAPAVGYLTGLPGTTPDSLMEHVAVLLGIRHYRWDDIAAELSERIKAAQRATALPPELPQADPDAGVVPPSLLNRRKPAPVLVEPQDAQGVDDGTPG